MSLVSVSTLTPMAAPWLRNCPNGILVEALRMMARRFCVETECWRESYTLSYTANATTAGPVTVPTGYDAMLLRIAKMELDGRELGDNGWTVLNSGVVQFDQAPSSANESLALEVVWEPLAYCEEYPEWLLERWGDGSAAGAIWWLKSQPDKPWADPQGGTFWVDRYTFEQGRAKSQNLVRQRTGQLRVPYRQFI